jgi:hypothetical protein
MTQIANLILLAPEIQELILNLPTISSQEDSVTENSQREIVTGAVWSEQKEPWAAVTDCPWTDMSGLLQRSTG